MAEFRTSFIPKKNTAPVAEKKQRKNVNILSFIAFIIFLISLLTAGGLYLYKVLIEKNIEEMSLSIDRVREAIEPDLVANLIEIDSRLTTSQNLLEDHKIISPIFRFLEDSTLKTIRFEDFKYDISENDGPVLRLSGEARNYTSLALQSDIFGAEEMFKEPIFSNLRLNIRGNVGFSFSTPINNASILYKNNLNIEERLVPEDIIEEEEEDTEDLIEESSG